jgi:hypothetical protein
MVPWINYRELLERRQTYDPIRFRNECLGLPSELGDHIVTRAELEKFCQTAPMAQTLRDVPQPYWDYLVAGIDWSGGVASRTCLVIGYMSDDNVFNIVRFECFAACEEPDYVMREVCHRCNQFHIRVIGADGLGNGVMANRLLLGILNSQCPFYAIEYSGDQEPVRDGALWRWKVRRSASIGHLFGRVKKNMIRFPAVADCGAFLDELGCEIAVHDNMSRSIKYDHPPNQPDDALHAANYALLIAARDHMMQHRFEFPE